MSKTRAVGSTLIALCIIACVVGGLLELLGFLRCDLVVLCLLYLIFLGVIVDACWGLVATVRLLAALVLGRPIRIRLRRLLIAAAIVLVPLALFGLVTWHPEMSEWCLCGLTVPQVTERVGMPDSDSRRNGGYAPRTIFSSTIAGVLGTIALTFTTNERPR